MVPIPEAKALLNMAAAAGYARVTLLAQSIVDAKLDRCFWLRVILQKINYFVQNTSFRPQFQLKRTHGVFADGSLHPVSW